MNVTQATDVDAQIADLYGADNGTAVEIETQTRAVTGSVADTDVERLADDVVRRIVTVETDDDADDVTLTVDDDGNGPFAPTATLEGSLERVHVLDEQDDEIEQDSDAALDALAAGEWDVATVATAFEIAPQVATNLVENGRHAGDILKWADNLDGALGDFPGVGVESAKIITAKIPLLEKRGVTKYGPTRDDVDEQDDGLLRIDVSLGSRQSVDVGRLPPTRVLERYPSEKKSDDPEAAFVSDLASTVSTTIGATLDELETGATLGTIVVDGRAWSFEPADSLEGDEQDDTAAETAPAGDTDQGDEDENEATLDAVSVDERAETLEDLGLSGREAEVTAHKEKGLTHAEIADELDSTKSTVDEYSRRAGKKLEKARKLAESVDVF